MKKTMLFMSMVLGFVMIAAMANAKMCEYHQWKMKPCLKMTEPLPPPEPKPQAQPVVEEAFILEGVYFDTGSANIKPESHPVLDKNTKALNKKKGVMIEIVGYTDSVGNEFYNLKLSEARAKSIKDYFVNNGIDEKRITFKGKGKANPIADNATAEGRAKNRRIEIVYTK